MSAIPDSTLADSKRLIADLQRQLAECRAERDEALQRETATSEVLQVINSSPGDLGPVFDAMLEKAIHLCEGIQGTLWTFDGEQIRLAAAQGFSAELIETVRDRRERQDPGERDPVKRILRGERLIQILDMAVDPSHGPVIAAAAEIGGVGTIMFAALVKDSTPLGAFAIARREVRPFSDRQIALLHEFRRTGGHCDGKRTTPDRDARGIGAADRDRGGIAGHQ